MRNMICLMAAAAALAATPASAQGNAVAPVANEAISADANVTADMNSTVPDLNAVEPAPPPATLDGPAQAPADDDEPRGFPWGLLGLVGLVGLLGRRRRD